MPASPAGEKGDTHSSRSQARDLTRHESEKGDTYSFPSRTGDASRGDMGKVSEAGANLAT